jgi:hypothetical protein
VLVVQDWTLRLVHWTAALALAEVGPRDFLEFVGRLQWFGMRHHHRWMVLPALLMAPSISLWCGCVGFVKCLTRFSSCLSVFAFFYFWFTTHLAPNGQKALHKLATCRPSAILEELCLTFFFGFSVQPKTSASSWV